MSLLTLFAGASVSGVGEYDQAIAYNSATTYAGVPIESRPVFEIQSGVSSGFWTVLDPAAASDVLSSLTDTLEIQRGRSATSYGQWDPGRLSIRADDTTSALLPQATDLINVGSPLNVVVRRTATTPRIYLFSGFIDMVNTRWNAGSLMSDVDITAIDGMRALNIRDTSITGSFAQRPSERMHALFDAIGYVGTRSFDTLTDVLLDVEAATPRNVLTSIRRVEEAEGGAFFFNGAGTACFRGRNQTWPQRNPKAVFSDDPDTDHVARYTALSTVSSDDVVVNRVTVQGSSFADQTATDGTGKPRDLRISDSLVCGSSNALALATFLLSKRGAAEVQHRIESLEMNAYENETNLDAAMTLDLLDVIRVQRAAPLFGISTDLVIVGIRHVITKYEWLITYSTQARA